MKKGVIFFFIIIFIVIKCGNDPAIPFPEFSDPSFLTKTNYNFDGNIAYARDRAEGLVSGSISDVSDPSFITRVNYSFDGFILSARTEASLLSPGNAKPPVLAPTVTGIVLNDYNASYSGTYFNGFFIQDKYTAIFVRITSSTSGVIVTRGDLVSISVPNLYKSGSTGAGQLQIYKPSLSDITILSSGNKIYCVDINSPTSLTNPTNGPQFVKIRGTVSTKSSSNPASWGLDTDSWAIRIPISSERNFSGILPDDDVIVFGVVDWYSGSMTSAVSNRYLLWVYDTASSIYSSTNNNDIVEGIVLNNYDASTSGTYFNGFFIQDKNTAIFVRITNNNSGISVNRGDKVRISITEYKTNGNLLQIYNPSVSDIIILSIEHKIYYIDINFSTSNANSEGRPIFAKIKGKISKKNSDDPATWGMNNNNWAIRIPIESERNFPDILPNDDILAYGIVDWYDQSLAGGDVTNKYALWVYDTTNFIFDLSTK